MSSYLCIWIYINSKSVNCEYYYVININKILYYTACFISYHMRNKNKHNHAKMIKNNTLSITSKLRRHAVINLGLIYIFVNDISLINCPVLQLKNCTLFENLQIEQKY